MHRFKFEYFWTKHEGCGAVVESGWMQPAPGVPMFKVVLKIRSVRMALNSWQRSTFGNRGREIGVIRDRLQCLITLPITHAHQQEHLLLSDKLEGLLETERLYWKQ